MVKFGSSLPLDAIAISVLRCRVGNDLTQRNDVGAQGQNFVGNTSMKGAELGFKNVRITYSLLSRRALFFLNDVVSALAGLAEYDCMSTQTWLAVAVAA